MNEAEPLEKEVAIDPEMLGKVFENLIEENRRKGLGAYCTPREIVHYMCQESLINYLDNGLNHPAKPIGAVTPLPENQPPLFVNSEEKSKPKLGQLESGSFWCETEGSASLSDVRKRRNDRLGTISH